MSVGLRLAGVVLALLVPALLLGNRLFADGPSMRIPASAIPGDVGPWSAGAEQRLDPVALDILAPDSYVARTYEDERSGRAPIAAYAAFYAGRAGRSKAAHDPEVCFPAGGWQSLGSRDIEVPIARGGTLVAQLLDVERGNARQLVLYWFQPAARWPRGVVAEELTFLLDAVAGRPQYAFVRLVAGVPDAASRAAVLGDLLAFAGEFAWPLRDVVTGERPAATARTEEIPASRSLDRERVRGS